ncbi:MAG TPA: hypothetical protein VIL00_10755 [Pseudonocardiaceae bacterium]
MTSPYDNPQLRELAASLDRSLAELDRVATEASRFQPRSRSLSPEDLAEMERYARSGNAPKELRELQQRIDAGELSWQDVASGRVANDPQVQRALSSGLPDLTRAYQMIQEGHDLDEIIEAGSSGPGFRSGSSTPSSRPVVGGDDDDDGEVSYLR